MAMGSTYKSGGRLATSIATRRGAYDDLNIDPYANRPIRAGSRQEDYKDILAHGDRSDTDWQKIVKKNMKALKDTYHSNETGWARRNTMDETSRLLFEATVGNRGPNLGKLVRSKADLSEKMADKGYRVGTAEELAAIDMAHQEQTQKTMAKWMATYNANTNTAERIAQSEQRTKHRAKFSEMQISRERMNRKKSRGAVRRGTSSLQVGGSMTGLGL